ncbi:hypothetical protein ACFQ9X_10320 [Catenulispora yoronensis]
MGATGLRLDPIWIALVGGGVAAGVSAVAGALLLTLGATYERRVRDLRALGRRFGGLR